MASSKPKTTMNKLNRERKVREKRLDKAARKVARQNAAPPLDEFGYPLDEFGNRIVEEPADDELDNRGAIRAAAHAPSEEASQVSSPPVGS
jgi:hypothetical protein